MLMFPCPALHRFSRLPVCRIYSSRPANCTTFPIDERDLKDRDLVNPREPCGFSFLPESSLERPPPDPA
jgi:Fe-S-cluster containining protein